MSKVDGFEVVFNDEACTASTSDQRVVNMLEERWIGKKRGRELILELVEVAYLILEGRATVKTTDGKYIRSLNELMQHEYKCFKDFFWPQLLVYKDLRDRGRRVRVVDQERFLIKDKSGDLRLVLVLEEKKMRGITDIMREVENARSNSLQLVLAIVSLQGDITYYEANKIALEVV
ncbi:endonuclease [Desulfurococcus amylolyticus]|uniref:endonuclease n=1 Tax=Desulfurococcus amylolyticus TaxID=94694 RepID=UPI000324BD39